MIPQAKKAAEEILRAVDSRPIYEEEAAAIIDRAFADVLRERDELIAWKKEYDESEPIRIAREHELREALATWVFRWDDGGFYDLGHGELIELCRALLSK